MDSKATLIAAINNFGRIVSSIPAEAWTRPTPDTDWDVKAVVNHVTSEILWIPDLLAGQTIAQVGTKYDGDVAGSDPTKSWAQASAKAVKSINDLADTQSIVHLSFGDTPAEAYLGQMIIDITIHGWDASAGAGLNRNLPEDLAGAAYELFKPQAEQWRSGGALGPQVQVAADATTQDKLLALSGRNPAWQA